LGVLFRISPSTFFQVYHNFINIYLCIIFQTNTRAAGILYTQIGDLLGLPSTEKQQIGIGEITNDSTVELPAEIGESSAGKKPKLDYENVNYL
jgi:hypothetical protein